MPTNHEWEIHKADIRRLYLVEEKPLKELLEAVTKLGLSVTKAQLEYRLKLWKFKRNGDKETWQYVDNRIKKRSNPSEVILSGKRLKLSTVEKERKRHREMTVLARIAPPPSPQSPKDSQISVCTPQPFNFEFEWPRTLPWLQFQTNYSHMFSSLEPQSSRAPDFMHLESHSQNISRSLISSFTNTTITEQRPSPSKLASSIGITMPESYPGEHLTRADIIANGSGLELLREFMMVEIFQISNNLTNLMDRWNAYEELKRVLRLLRQSGIMNSPLDFKVLNDATISAFFEKLFQSAFCRLLEFQPESPRHYEIYNERPGSGGQESKVSDELHVIKWLLQSRHPTSFRFWWLGIWGTPLQHSLHCGGVELVELLLKHGADVDLAPSGSDTPLMIALRTYLDDESKRLKLVTLLLEAGADVNLAPSGSDTPLMIALKYRHGPSRLELVTLLLEAGADVNLAPSDSDTPLMIALSTYLDDESKRLELVTLLLEAGADVNLAPSGYMTPLSMALQRPKELEVINLVLDAGAKATSSDLHVAISGGNLEIVQTLLGLDANLLCGKCLSFAAHVYDRDRAIGMVSYILGLFQQRFTPDVVATMIERYALAPAARNGNDDLLIFLFRLCTNISAYDDGITPLHEAARQGHERACELLISHGAQVNTRPGKPSPLHVATCRDNTGVVDILIAAGAELNSAYQAMPEAEFKQYFGHDSYPLYHAQSMVTPLQIALRRSFSKCAIKLIQAGAKLEGGELKLAAYCTDVELFDVALSASADIHEEDGNGRSMLHWVLHKINLKNEETRFIRMLQNHNTLPGGVRLAAATRLGDVPMVEQMLTLGIQPVENIGMLEIAVHSESLEMVNTLLRWFPTWYEARALVAAVETGRGLEFVGSLLRNRSDSTPLLYEETEAITKATKQEDSLLVQKLLESLPSPAKSYPRIKNSENPLQAAIKNGDEETFRHLVDFGYVPDWWVLHALATRDDTSWARNVITYGSFLANENLRRSETETFLQSPLTIAVSYGNIEMLQLLLTTGLDIDDAIGSEGFTSRSALQLAVEKANLPVMDILLKAGANINAPAAFEFGATALQLAAIKGHLGIAKQLLDLGADINAKRAPRYGRTALEGAAEHGRIDMIGLLLRSGVKTTGTRRRQYLRAIRFAQDQCHQAAAELVRSFREWTMEDEQMMASINQECWSYWEDEDDKDEYHSDEDSTDDEEAKSTDDDDEEEEEEQDEYEEDNGQDRSMEADEVVAGFFPN